MFHGIQELMLLTGTKLIGSSAGAAHLLKDNAGVRSVGSTWAETSCGLEGDMLPLFESTVRLSTVNAGPIDPLVIMLFYLEVSEKLPQG
jgi:hypothetical protein